MENTNPTGKTLDMFVKEAKEKNIKLIIVGDGGMSERALLVVNRMREKGEVILVNQCDLLDDDQKKITDIPTPPPRSPFEAEPTMITRGTPIKEMYLPTQREVEKPWYHNMPDRKKKKRR